MSWLKRRLPKRRWKRVMLYLLSGFLILLAADMILAACWRRIEISPETTNITSPLNAAGLPDYIAAYNADYGRGVTLDNNAMPLLLELIGTQDLPESAQSILPVIGLPSDPKPPFLLSYTSWCKRNIASSPMVPAMIPATNPQTTRTIPAPATPPDLDNSTQIVAVPSPGNHEMELLENEEELRAKPWTRADNPLPAQYLASQRQALQLALRAVDRPRYFLPIPTESADTAGMPPDLVSRVIAGTLCRLSPLRNLAGVLAMDAMRCIGEGDMAGFQRDALAIAKLARLVDQGPTYIEHLVALSIDGLASRTIKTAATRPDFFTASQAQQFLRALNSLGSLPPPLHAMNSLERWFSLYRYCNMSRSGNAFVPIHYNAVLRTFNHNFDQLVACYEQSNYHERKARFEALQSEVDHNRPSMVLGVTNPAMFFFSIALPSLNKSAFIADRNNTDHELARLALALAGYKAQHGRYPDALSQLLSDDLKEIPLDPFSGVALIYRITPIGYVLYSVGPNEKDDGGVERDSNHPKDWDIVVRATE